MAISSENVRKNITLNKELARRLEEIAEKDNRSFSNLVEHVLKIYIENMNK